MIGGTIGSGAGFDGKEKWEWRGAGVVSLWIKMKIKQTIDD